MGNNIAKTYDDLNFVLSDNAPQLESAMLFDADRVAAQLAQLNCPDPADIDAVQQYNKKYLEVYQPLDHSGEFQQAIDRQTFDDSFVMPSFDDLTEKYADEKVPFLDQGEVSHHHMAPHQRYSAENGYLLIEGMISADICDEYVNLRNRLNLGPHRFPSFTPYVEHDVIRRMFLTPEMNMLINDLVGEELGLHFNLTPFTSTERSWHQDEYLNPPGTYGRYIAAWIAVDDVPSSSGPFQFVPGSHKLPTVARDKVMPYLKQQFQLGYSDNYDWSVHSASFVGLAYLFKIAKERRPIKQFLGKKGDVLLWHSRLIHRGAPAYDRSVMRPGIIGHYSPIRTARWFGSDIRRYGNGGYYWHFD